MRFRRNCDDPRAFIFGHDTRLNKSRGKALIAKQVYGEHHLKPLRGLLRLLRHQPRIQDQAINFRARRFKARDKRIDRGKV